MHLQPVEQVMYVWYSSVPVYSQKYDFLVSEQVYVNECLFMRG